MFERYSTATERQGSVESVKHYITDMDGVLVKGTQLIPDAHRLHNVGLEIPTERLFTSAMPALIERASGKAPFYVGKPNPGMMRLALNHLDVHSEDTVMVGDRVETGIVAGVESGMKTILLLSGVTSREDIDQFPYRPTWVSGSIAEIQL